MDLLYRANGCFRESINFASRTYWGDPTKFQFYSSIESFDESITYEIGEDRAVKNTFNITLNGYIIPESINKSLASMNKVYGISQVVFGLETSNSEAEILSTTKTKKGKSLGKALVQDGTNSYITIYGSICSNAVADIIDVSSNINGINK
jgi:hypothetical protein